MLGELWNDILELTARFVIPDWGEIIALLPIVMFVLIVAALLWVFVRLWRAAPAQRGKTRIEPRTPAGIHMPGPTYSPVLAAIGAFMLFLGLVFGGDLLLIGTIVLAATLIVWLVEALRVYDHDIGDTAPKLPAEVHDGPPPGVHMPGPSFRPFLGAIGTAMLMLGLVFGEWLLAAGVIALVATLVGWLVDARREYDKTIEADATGHLENIPAPRWPSVMFGGLAILLVGAIVIQLGWLPPSTASGGDAPTASGGPPPDGSGEPEASTPSGPAADIVLTAKDITFDQASITGPADVPFTIALVNDDQGVPHNVELLDSGGTVAWKGDIFDGVDTRVYDVEPLPAGAYTFLCSVHPSMTGTATLD
jgi:plastocyanin